MLHKGTGETLRLGGSAYRVVGIYQTGDAFEDSGALLSLPDAQDLLGKPGQVSLYYIQLKAPELRQRLIARTAPVAQFTGEQRQRFCQQTNP